MSENAKTEQNFGQLPPEQKISQFSAAILERQAQLQGLPVGSAEALYLNAQISNLSIERDAVRLQATEGGSLQAAHDKVVHQHGLQFDESDRTGVSPELTVIQGGQERSA